MFILGSFQISDLTPPVSHDRHFPSFRQIRIIQAIAKYRGIGQAAEALHLSQPALTRALQAVEDLLGVKLFDRLPNSVVPTIYAQPILKRAHAIENTIRETERDIQNLLRPDLNRLRIGAGIHAIEIWANRAASMLALANHDIEILIEQYDWNDLVQHVLDGSLDFSLGEISGLEQHPHLVIEPLVEVPLHFVCRSDHPLTAIENPGLEEMARYPMVGSKLARPLAEHIRPRIGKLGIFDPDTGGIISAIRVNNLNAITQTLLASDAIALMPLASIRNELASDQLVPLSRLQMPWLVGRIGFISAKARTESVLSRAFRHAVHRIEAERLDAIPASHRRF